MLLFINHCVTFKHPQKCQKQVQHDRMWTTVMRASLASPAEIQRAQLKKSASLEFKCSTVDSFLTGHFVMSAGALQLSNTKLTK